MLHNKDHLFYTMFGERGFKKRSFGEVGCWQNSRLDIKRGLADMVRQLDGPEPKCDRNWFHGSTGSLGVYSNRPNFPKKPAPALMGFDDTIRKYCDEKLGRQYPGNPDEAIAHGCVEASLNVMRVAQGWDMCMNLAWLLCATRGKLPGGNNTIYFAVAPGSLRNDDGALLNRGGWYHSGMVFFLEVCLLQTVCRNGEELLNLQRGQPFVCDVGDAAYREAAARSLERALK
jgi:hypothetical protein